MNHLEQIVGEWYEYSGYFVRRNVLVGKRSKGGYEGELDIVAFNPQTDHLVHIEPSLDADAWGRLEEHESFGTVEANLEQAWGTPVALASTKLPRGLWSPSPPLWLLLTFITLLVIIWGHYLEVIYKLFKLRKKAAES